jgi:DNA-binding CsgD family transcriptional regulator/PAS domain-containing protein
MRETKPLDVPEELRVARLAAHALDAARNRAVAPRFIGELCETFGADLAFVATHDKAAGTCELLMHDEPMPAALADYAETWYRVDPWLAMAHMFRATCAVLHGDELVPESELLRTDFFRSWLEPCELRHWLGGTIAREREKLTYVALLRSPGAGAFARFDKLRLRRLLPHLETGLRLGAEPPLPGIGSSIAMDALEHLPFGVIGLDGEGKVRYASSRADEILKQNDGLLLRNGTLRATFNADGARLEELVASVLTGRGSPTFNPSGVLAISRPSGARAYVLNVFGHAPDLSVGGPPAAAAVVFIHDPEASAVMDGKMLRTLYELTPAEAKLACLLSFGRSVSSAASELGITMNTARTHLKRLYSKTGTSRQSELVHLLVGMLAMGSSTKRPLEDAPESGRARPTRGSLVRLA